ncbi:MAG: prepilin-type N-terminal cleavage/methylation domain-containing protein [Variibacter sp.]|nr:prepilin-type N-terminal cleavage/methylation domain-containing protein [Variibacter sp.]
MLRSTSSCGEDGFTLLEVLVALALVAAALAALGALFATSARATRAIDQRLALEQTARSVLAGLPARGELVPGSITGERLGYRWRLDVQPLASQAGDGRRPPPWQPQAIVLRIEAPGGQVLRLETVRLRPGLGGAGR